MNSKKMTLKEKKALAREGLLALGSLLVSCVLSVWWFNYALMHNLAFGFPVFFYTIFVLTFVIYGSARFIIWAVQILKQKE